MKQTHLWTGAGSIVLLVLLAGLSPGAEAGKPRTGKLPHLEFNVDTREIRVECEALDTNAPLEFFLCKTGTNEYESVLRSDVKPSDLHTALLAIGLKPGSPVTYSEALKKLIPPHGPPLRISVEYQSEGKTISAPAVHWLRDTKSKKEPGQIGWVFAGSRVMPDGKYAADTTGYLVSIVNFDLTVIDIGELASSANETLEWERNPDIAPKGGTKVTMVIQPVGAPAAHEGPAPANPPASIAPGGAPVQRSEVAAPATAPQTSPSLSDVHIDQEKIDRLEKYWQEKVSPHEKTLRDAAAAHYEVIAQLRAEQQRLIDEADRVQRAIEKLEKQYQDLTTPHPENGAQ